MKKIGLFYAANAVKTSQVAKKIRKVLGAENVDIIPAEQAWGNDFEAYDNLIIGVSTWFDGELPTYWDELIPELETLDLIPIILPMGWGFWAMLLKRRKLL